MTRGSKAKTPIEQGSMTSGQGLARLPPPSRQALFEQYHSVVRQEATYIHRRLPAWWELAAVTEAGMVGLLEALNRYEVTRRDTFGAFIRYRIRGEIMEYLRSLDWASRGVRSWGRKLAAARQRCAGRLGR